MRTAISRRRRNARASKQIGDVRAGDEQHDRGDADEPGRDLRVVARFGPRSTEHGPAIARGFAIVECRGVRIFCVQLFLVALLVRVREIGVGALERHARFAAREELRTTSCCTSRTTASSDCRRSSAVMLATTGTMPMNGCDSRPAKLLRRDADDRVLVRADVRASCRGCHACRRIAFARTHMREPPRSCGRCGLSVLVAVKNRPMTGLTSNIRHRSAVADGRRSSALTASPGPTAS